MTPAIYLGLCLLVTAVAVCVYGVTNARRRATLRQLADRREMHFAAGDRFNLATQVARRFPVVGVAQPTISDVLYCRRDDRYCYVFRFDYTVGTIGTQRRRKSIVGYTEPKDGGGPSGLIIAPDGPELVEQYQDVIAQLRGENVKQPEA